VQLVNRVDFLFSVSGSVEEKFTNGSTLVYEMLAPLAKSFLQCFVEALVFKGVSNLGSFIEALVVHGDTLRTKPQSVESAGHSLKRGE
jgi:hypothetical protein